MIILITTMVIFAYFVSVRPSDSLPNVVPQGEKLIVTTPGAPLVSPDFRIYKNLLLRFSIIFPKNLRIKEYDDGTSASTITFDDPTSGHGFQIFVVPYQHDQITPEQFKRDIPSGVMKEPVDVIIDGVRGTVFYSQDPVIGETREVWFIHRGFLYEITTPKDLDRWVADIMKTWRFLEFDENKRLCHYFSLSKCSGLRMLWQIHKQFHHRL